MSHVNRFALVTLCCVAVGVTSIPAEAKTPAPLTCATSKRKAAVKRVMAKAGCAAKATGKGVGVDPVCLLTAEYKFQVSYFKAEGKGGCATTANASSVGALVDACVSNIRSGLGAGGSPVPKSKCLGGKLRATPKKLTSKLNCDLKALSKGVPTNPDCLTAAEQKFTAAFAKAEMGTDCVTTGDAAGLEAVVDTCLADVTTAEPSHLVVTSTFTGAEEMVVVPAGVTKAHVQACGAQGGAGAIGGNAATGGAGGLGGCAEGDLAVTPGSTLFVYVGGMGNVFNGAGAGGNATAGNGGGASDIRSGGNTVADRKIVGGGGGGGGRAGCEDGGVSGGAGGTGGDGGAGVNGSDSPTSGGVAGGGMGGQLGLGGAAGLGCTGFLGMSGNADGTGGAGQTCCCFSFPSVPGGGGGGGGASNGGGGGGGSAGTVDCSGNDKGAGGGGAGGTSSISGVTSGVTNPGVQSGDGVVTITF